MHASIAERLPSRTAGSNGAHAVGPEDGLLLTHPATGASVELRASALEPEPDRAVAVNEQIVRGLPGPRERFLVVWRLLPDRERLPPPPTATAPVVDSTRACSRPPRIRLGSSLRDVRRANTRALLLSCHDRALPELRTVATESSGTHTALVVRA